MTLRSRAKSLRRRVGRMVARYPAPTIVQEKLESLVAEPASFPRVDDKPLPPGAEPIEGHWPKPAGSVEQSAWPEGIDARGKLIARRVARYGSLRFVRPEQVAAAVAGYDDGCLGDYRVWPPTPAPGGGWLSPLLLANERWSRSVDVRFWEQGFRMARADGRVPGWMGECDWHWWSAGLRNRQQD